VENWKASACFFAWHDGLFSFFIRRHQFGLKLNPLLHPRQMCVIVSLCRRQLRESPFAPQHTCCDTGRRERDAATIALWWLPAFAIIALWWLPASATIALWWLPSSATIALWWAIITLRWSPSLRYDGVL